MKISEIQRNNFFNHASQGCIKISSVNYEKKLIHAQTVGVISSEDLMGINLSEKWIERFGFTKVSSEAYLDVQVTVFKKENVFLGHFSNGKIRVTYNGKSFEIEYVHQLQDFLLKLNGHNF